MKYFLFIVLFGLECFILKLNCFKLPDSDLIYADHYIKSRSSNKNFPSVLYPANRQDSLYEDLDYDSASYKKALAALAEAAAENSYDYQMNSSEVNSEELADPIEARYDDTEIKADPRDEETESHSSLVGGHQYVSGGAGEGKQHLQPDGSIPNKEEVKSDEDLPAYCDPPNPCPLGYISEDCDPRPYSEFTAEFSRNYQEQQNCMCDDDHNDCKRSIHSKSNEKMSAYIRNTKPDDIYSAVVAKKSPRMRRDLHAANDVLRQNKLKKLNPYLRGEAIRIHVAKKSAPF